MSLTGGGRRGRGIPPAAYPSPMPTYDYELLDNKGNPTGKTFEYVQPA